MATRGVGRQGKKHANSILAGDLQVCYQIHGTGSRLWAKSGGDSSGNNLRTVTYTPDALNQYDAIATPGSFGVLVRSADTVGAASIGTVATGDWCQKGDEIESEERA